MRTAANLHGDLSRIGLHAGDTVMVHAAVRRIGPVLGGPDAVIDALRWAVGPGGTVIAYLDWDADWDEFTEPGQPVPEPWRAQVRPFDPAATRAARYVGVLPEFLRTTPGAVRSGNPGASVAAIGARAAWLTADHPLDYGYGPGSPFARLVEAGGKVLMLGAPLDTMTLLHHAEHLARLPDKRVVRTETPFRAPDGGVDWRWVEEFDTCDPVVTALPDNFIERIVEAYLATGAGHRGQVGDAPSVLVEAAAILPFAVEWLELEAGGPSGSVTRS